MAADDALVPRIERLAERGSPGLRAEVLELRAMAGGLSRTTWQLHLRMTRSTGAHADLDLVLQMLPDAGLLESDLGAEFDLLAALAGTPVPAPTPYWLDPDGCVLGSPGLITGHVSGACDPFILARSQPLEVRLGLAQEFMRLLVSLVNTDTAPVTAKTPLKDPGVDAARIAVEQWTARHESVRMEANPELALVQSWLAGRAPATPRRVLVHGDFKPGNVLVRHGRVVALLDWETAHLGSPLEDLGWVTNAVRRREHQLADHWETPQMVTAFETGTGIRVDPDELRWWNVFSCYKLAVIVLSGVHGYLTGGLPQLHHPPTWLYRAMFKAIGEAP
jgi:aminoglycoside phosphotransferase (APT) family kinase protein